MSSRNNSEDNTLLMASCQVPAIPKGEGNNSYPVVCLIIDAARIFKFFSTGGAWFSISVGTLSAWTVKGYQHFLIGFAFFLYLLS